MKPKKKNGQWKNTNSFSLLTLKKCHSDPCSQAKIFENLVNSFFKTKAKIYMSRA